MPAQYNIHNIDNNKVSTKTYNKEGLEYKILYLNKNTYENDDVENGIFRSVILDYTGSILSFGLPKSVSNKYFKEKFQEISTDLQVNEAVEGTMVNLFYDTRIESWEISTRTAISGNYWWTYKSPDRKPEPHEKIMQMTFRAMFLQTLGYNENTPFNDVIMFQSLPKDCIFSFVFQHPSNQIIVPVEYARLYLVSVYKKFDSNLLELIPLSHVKLWSQFNIQNSVIHFPVDYSSQLNSYNEIYNYLAGMVYLHKGIMITDNETGYRTCFVNSDYENMRKTVGNEKNQEYRMYLQYRYYVLKYAEQLQNYLVSFQMTHKHMFQQFEKEQMNLIYKIQERYRIKYDPVNRGKVYEFVEPRTYGEKAIPKHIERLHKDFYIAAKARGEKRNITKDVVNEYFNSLAPLEQWLALQPIRK